MSPPPQNPLNAERCRTRPSPPPVRLARAQGAQVGHGGGAAVGRLPLPALRGRRGRRGLALRALPGPPAQRHLRGRQAGAGQADEGGGESAEGDLGLLVVPRRLMVLPVSGFWGCVASWWAPVTSRWVPINSWGSPMPPGGSPSPPGGSPSPRGGPLRSHGGPNHFVVVFLWLSGCPYHLR